MILAISIAEVLLSAGVFLLALFWLRNRKKMDPRFPPGPRQLPLIGNMHQIGKQPQDQFFKWADEFGAAYSINLAGEKFIHLNDPKLIKEVFSDSRATGRSTHPVFAEFAQGYHGLIMSVGEHWQEQRRFILRTLRDLGFAKTSMEALILEEATAMVNWFEKRLDKPIRGDGIFNGPVVNSLWRIISGERTDWDSPNRPELIKRAGDIIRNLNHMMETGLLFFPSLRHVFPDKMGWTDYLKSVQGLLGASKEAMEKHKRKFDPDNPGDLIDQYLIEMNRTTNPNSSFFKEVGEKNLIAAIGDLFLAGSETTSSSLSFSLLLLSHHPKIQQKLQAELDTVLGRERQPSLTDKSKLQYLEAIVKEIFRITCVGVNGMPHRISEDAVIGGYFFPKDISVIGNIYRIHHDPKIWGDPSNFRPERFLSPDGNRIIRHEAYQPFAVGKRQCIGNTMAEDTMFLFIASIFQRFSVKPVGVQGVYTIHPGTQLTNYAPAFEVIVSIRKTE